MAMSDVNYQPEEGFFKKLKRKYKERAMKKKLARNAQINKGLRANNGLTEEDIKKYYPQYKKQ